MPNPNTLSLQRVADIIINVAPAAAPRATFNQILIVGKSGHIPQSMRIMQVDQNFAVEMTAQGFQTTDPEYIAMQVYFNQTPAPSSGFVGCQDPTALQVEIVDADNAGHGYAPGDIVGITQAGASGGQIAILTVLSGALSMAGYQQNDVLTLAGGTGGTIKVLTVDGSGNILTFSILTAGSGYSISTNNVTTDSPAHGTGAKFDISAVLNGVAATIQNYIPGTGYIVEDENATTAITGSGSGLKVNITGIGESPLQAITACRAANFEWYVGVVLTAIDADHKLIADWAESAQPSTVYAFTCSEADVLNGVSSNIGLFLKNLGYKRTIWQYSTVQGTANPDAAYAIIGVLGYAMGQNSGTANSAFTLKFKSEVEIATEPLTLTQIANIEGAGGNLYLSYGNYYNWFEQGIMADGETFFDQIINRDMLANNIQLNIADVLNGSPKIPQTDPGETTLIHAVNQAGAQAVTIGYLAAGTFNPVNGLSLLSLSPGDPIPAGYIAIAQPYSKQTNADRSARKAMPIYMVVCEAGAVHSLTVQVNVQI
jgi:hypothetical protein